MKAKKSNLYTMWSLAIVLCVLLSVFALLFASCAKGSASEPEDSPGLSVNEESLNAPEEDQNSQENTATPPDTEPDATGAPETAATRLAETEDAGIEYQDKFVFLGDSTTYGLKYYGVLSGGNNTTQVWTPESGTLTLSQQSFATIVYPETGEQLTIVDAVTLKQPEYLMITLGVNGVSFMDEENFVREYTSLVQSIQEASPDTKIICNSIYPVAASYKYLSDINNDKITQANVWIEQVAEDTGTRFLNSFEAIVGEDGNLPEQYQNGDGIHLTGEGFNIILNYLRTHEYK